MEGLCVCVYIYVSDFLVEDNGNERKVFPITKKGNDAGFLALRFHVVRDTSNDEFVEKFEESVVKGTLSLSSTSPIDDSDAYYVGYTPVLEPPKLSLVKSYKDDSGTTWKVVRPGPDPSRPEQTKFMTESMIVDVTHQPSTRWIECGRSGSGSLSHTDSSCCACVKPSTVPLGSLYVEVLYATSLVNPRALGPSKPDPFVGLCFEESFVCTDVIRNRRSPYWLPWTRRAAWFHVTHPFSVLTVGVFDWGGEYKTDVHQPLGRIVINVDSLTDQSEHLVTYPLLVKQKKKKQQTNNNNNNNGTLTLRIRKVMDRPRSSLLKGLHSPVPSPMEIIVREPNASKALNYMVHGGSDSTDVRLQTLQNYIQELLSYTQVSLYVQQAVLSVIFWRGTVGIPILFGCCGPIIWIPLPSMVAFGCGVYLTDHLHLLPSFVVLSFALALCGTMIYRQNSPNPWRRTLSYREHWVQLLWGVLPNGNNHPPIDGYDEQKVQEHNAFWTTIQDEQQQKKQLRASLQQSIAKEQQKTQGMDIHDNLSLELQDVWNLLYPLQAQLVRILILLRRIKHVVTWEESTLTFWILNALFLLAAALALVPWTLVMEWAFRILVWTFLAPWMYFVGLLYKGRSLLEETELVHRLRQEIRDKFRQQREDKLRDQQTKRKLFGDYVTQVPVLKQTAQIHTPTSTSTSHALPTSTLKEEGEEEEPPPQLSLPLPLPPSMVSARLIGQSITTQNGLPTLTDKDELEHWAQARAQATTPDHKEDEPDTEHAGEDEGPKPQETDPLIPTDINYGATEEV